MRKRKRTTIIPAVCRPTIYQLINAATVANAVAPRFVIKVNTALPVVGFIPRQIITIPHTTRCPIKNDCVWCKNAIMAILIDAMVTLAPNLAEPDPKNLGMTLSRSPNACQELLEGKCSGPFGARSQCPRETP